MVLYKQPLIACTRSYLKKEHILQTTAGSSLQGNLSFTVAINLERNESTTTFSSLIPFNVPTTLVFHPCLLMIIRMSICPVKLVYSRKLHMHMLALGVSQYLQVEKVENVTCFSFVFLMSETFRLKMQSLFQFEPSLRWITEFLD